MGADGTVDVVPPTPLSQPLHLLPPPLHLHLAASASRAAIIESAGKASAFASSTERSQWLKSKDATDWNTDTGATSHMTPHRSWFTLYSPHKVPIRLADHSIIFSEGIGSVEFQPSGMLSSVVFHDVLHVPSLSCNLLSLYHLTRWKGYEIHLCGNKANFLLKGKTVFTATVNESNTGYPDGQVVIPRATHTANGASTVPLTWELWHRRFAHLNHHDVKLTHKNKLVTGMKLESNALPDPICEPCILGKQH